MDIREKIRMLAETHLKTNLTSPEFIGGGSFGRAYKCADVRGGKIYVLKIFTASGIAEKETESLSALAKNGAVKIPIVYFVHYKNSEFDFDCICMEYISGKNALFNLKLLIAPKRIKEEFAADVVNGISAIHSIKSENGKFGSLANPEYPSWNEYYSRLADNIYKKAVTANENGKFDKSVLEEMRKAYKFFDRIFSEEVNDACLIHGDCNVMNIMVDKSCKLAAFIDPLNSLYADREFDLFQLQNMTGNCFKLYDTYKSINQHTENCDIKCAFYALWNEANVYLTTGNYEKIIMAPVIKRLNRQIKKFI